MLSQDPGERAQHAGPDTGEKSDIGPGDGVEESSGGGERGGAENDRLSGGGVCHDVFPLGRWRLSGFVEPLGCWIVPEGVGGAHLAVRHRGGNTPNSMLCCSGGTVSGSEGLGVWICNAQR